MNKEEYLNILQTELSGLPREERDNVMEYYTEYFDEAGEDKVSDVIMELGSPYELAAKIMKENAKSDDEAGGGSATNASSSFNASSGFAANFGEVNFTEPYTGCEKKKTNMALWITVGVLGFPLWVTIGALAFAVIVTFGALIFTFNVVGAVLAFAGVVGCIIALIQMIWIGATGLMVAGMMLVVAGVGLLLLMASYGLCRAVSAIVKLIKRIFNRKEGEA